MNWDEVEGHWEQVKGSQWGKLTEDDVEVVKGKREELLGILQTRYGHAREEAEREVNSRAEQVKSLWAKHVKSD